jgi:hypothetical protein
MRSMQRAEGSDTRMRLCRTAPRLLLWAAMPAPVTPSMTLCLPGAYRGPQVDRRLSRAYL